MTTVEIIEAALQAHGFTPGLIRGFFEDGGEKWGREMRRCKSEGDANDLAKDIVTAMAARLGSKLRAHDYWCKQCDRSFEEYLSYNPYDLDELEAARTGERACPRCRAMSRPVILRAPGMHVASWLMQFGGKVYDKDDFDARVDGMLNREKPKRFFEQPNFTETFLGDFEETAVKTMSGELPSPPPVDPSVAEEIVASITKGV